MSKCVALLLISALLACSRCCAHMETGGGPPPDDEGVDYEDVPPSKFGERIYDLAVEFINGYVTGIQDVLDAGIKPIMFLVEKITEQLDQ